MNQKYVWYVAYGSNLCKERFMTYINGGLFQGIRNLHKGCNDKSPPVREKPFLIPHEVYFGNKASTWDGMGVAFIDADRFGVALGRAYLITEEQFYEIQKQEGLSNEWYGRIVELKCENDNIPHMTFTSNDRHKDNMPSEKYLDIIYKGLCETYPQFSCLQQNQETTIYGLSLIHSPPQPCTPPFP